MIAGHESKQLAEIAASLAEDVGAVYPGLTFKFLVYRRGGRLDAVEKIISSLNGHPAYDASRDLLRARPSTGENSAFIGVAVGHERGLFGMKGKPSCLAFIALNLDQYAARDEAQYALYHMMGQFFDLMSALTTDSFKGSGDVILQPKRNSLSMARANMKADIFSALMMTAEGEKDAIRDLARWRGMQSLEAQSAHRPEEYPYAISIDVAEFAAAKMNEAPGANLLKSVHLLSTGVSKTFDRQNLETWINFAAPAQSMAWSGSTPDQILGAALHTSANPFIKSIGNLLAEVTHVQPSDKESLLPGYNPFVDMEINHIAHDRQVEETFEMVMIHSMEADSALPLIRVANNQNESILKGKVMGWCAHGLQAAAKAYESALQRGVPPGQAARLEFESAKHQTDWSTLNRLNDHVLSQRRQGLAVTLSDIASWCKTSVDFRPLLESVNLTLADPGYMRKLAAAHEMPSLGPQLAAAAPAASMNFAPQIAFAPAGPQLAFGGGGISQRGNYVRPPVETTLTTDDE